MPDKIDVPNIEEPPWLKNGKVIPVVGNNLIFTPICIKAWNNIIEIDPTRINRILLLKKIN